MRVKRPYPNKNGPFENSTPQSIPHEQSQRYEELEALKEPVIEDQHWRCSAVHKRLCPMWPVPGLQISVHCSVEDGAPAAPALVLFQDGENHPLLCMAHILSNHFALTF